MLNPYFTHGIQTERYQVNDIIEESIQIMGMECFYIPRTKGSYDKILGEDARSVFSTAIPIEMYIETTTNKNPGGAGDVFAKFGLEIRDYQELSVSVQRWGRAIAAYYPDLIRPREGDLVYISMGNSFSSNTELHEIKFVEHESPFNQLNQMTIFKLKTEQFRFSNEVFETGIDEVDQYAGLVGTDDILSRLLLEDDTGVIMKESGLGYFKLDTPTELRSIRTFGDNAEIQKQALVFTEFTVTDPFGEI